MHTTKYMIRLWIVVALASLAHEGWTQTVSVNIFVNPQPPAAFYKWNEAPSPIQIAVNNFSTAEREAKFHFTFRSSDGRTVAVSNPDAEPLVTLRPGLSTIPSQSVFSTDIFTVSGDFKKSLEENKSFPEGVYDLCVTVTDAIGAAISAEPACGTFTIIKYEAPVLTYPPNDALICPDQFQKTVFQWTPMITSDPSNVGRFHFVISEIFPGQSAAEALASNIPVVEQLLPANQNFFIWPENLIPPKDTGDYAWGVNIFDAQDVEIAGYSEIFRTRCRPKDTTTGEQTKKDTLVTVDSFPPTIPHVDSTVERPKRDTIVRIDSFPPTIPHVDSTVERPKQDTIVRIDSFPPTIPHIDTTTIAFKCSSPGYKTLPGPKVSLGMVLDNPTAAAYPRAVPLRAEGIDWDVFIPLCSGCKGGVSEKPVAVRDDVGDYHWKLLSEKGSLNSPFDAKQIDSLAQAIQKMLDQLRMIDDSIAALNEFISTGLDQLDKELAKKIEDKKKEKKADEDDLNKKQASADSLSKASDEKDKKLTDVQKQLDDKQAELASYQQQIDSLEKLLKSGPNALEQSLAQQIMNKQDAIKGLKDELLAREQIWPTELDNLQNKILQAQSQLQYAVEKYNNEKDKLEALAIQIAAFETQLMASPDGRQFINSFNDWSKKALQFIKLYANNNSAQTRQQSVQTTAAGVFESVAPNTRMQRLQDFSAQLQQFNVLILASCNTASCHTAQAEVINSGSSLQNTVQSLVPGSFLLNAKAFLRTDTLRKNISGGEGGLIPLKNAVDKAAQQYEDALGDYNSNAAETEQSRQAYLDKISQAEKELTDLEKQLQDATEARRQDDDSKKESRTNQLDDARKNYDETEASLYPLGDSNMLLETELKDMKAELADNHAEIEKIKERIKSMDDYINALEAERANIPNKKKEAEAKLKALNEAKKKLEEELAKLKSKQDDLMKGNKEADGPFVYYIPPPLEEIMKNKPEFDRLKDSVARAEAELGVAYSKKEEVQGKLVKSIEKTAQNLVVYSDAAKTIEELEKQITELSDDISKSKTKKYQDYLKEQQDAQKEVTDAKKKSDETEEEYKKAEEASKDADEQLKDAKKEMQDHLKKMEEATQKILNARSQMEYEQKLLDNARNTAKQASQNLEDERQKINRLELDLARARNDLTRANALQQQDAITKAQQEVAQLERQLSQSRNNKIPSLEAGENSAKQSVQSALLRLRNAEKEDSTAFEEYSELGEELRKIGKDVNKKTEVAEAKKNKKDQEKKEKDKAEKEFEEAEKKRDEKAEEISKQVEEDADVKKTTDKKEDAEKKKNEASVKKTKSENDIKEALALKAKLISEGDAVLNAAKEKLKAAKRNLRDFLLREFDAVTLEVSIELTAKDKVVDKWRSSDGKMVLRNVIRYPGKRIPVMNNIHPDESLPVLEGVLSVCIPQVSYRKPSDASVSTPGNGLEPRTIALVYKNGEPLWPEWPVIPNNQPLLAKDVVSVTADGHDADQMIITCESGQSGCPPGGPLRDNIVDLGNYRWEQEGTKFGDYPIMPLMVWETAKVPTPLRTKPEEIKVFYKANDFAGDDEQKGRNLPEVKAGVLIECTKDTTGAPGLNYPIQGRVVTGDHLGLSAEEVEFEVKLVKGDAKDYGFDSTQQKISKVTDGSGYAKTNFYFGKGFAEFKIWIRWMRGGKMIEEDTLRVTSPLLLRFHRLGTGAPDFAFDAAMELFDKGGTAASAVAKFPKEEDKKEDEDKGLTIRGVAGLMDYERRFVNDENVEFKSTVSKPEPDKDKTRTFGLARTYIKDVPEDEPCSVTASVEQKYEPVARPSSDTRSTSTEKVERFKIGSTSNPFVIVLDEPATPGEPISGSGKLELTVAGQDIMQYLKEVPLEIADVVLEGEGDDAVATEGEVTWKAGDDNKRTILGLEFHLTSLTILAQQGARIEGTVRHTTFDQPLKFSAELDADGNFLGSIEDVPEIKIKGFKLEKGTAFDIDMHDGKSPGTMEASFKGILIRTAKLELPEIFNGADKEPTKMEVENFYIGSRYNENGERTMGFGGKASLSGSFFKMGYAGYEFAVKEFNLEFENSSLKAGGFKGELNLPIPFEGKVETEVNIAGEGWSAKVSTSNPVTLPNLGLSMTFKEGSGIDYNSETKIGKLTINAFLVTKQVGEMDITGFELSSDGSIKAKEITLEKALKFGSGFDLHAKSISFAFGKGEYSMTVKGGFSFPRIGIDELAGSVSIKNGPLLDVAFEKAEVDFEYNPVTFKGKFEYDGKEFSGSFDIGIKKVLPNGIQGMFVVGNQETPDKTGYSYWYAELKIGTKIPLGQTGLSVLGLGGGVGYNYVPPIGTSKGIPRKTDAFSFKAIMEMGTAPGGEVFAGRMEMVLVPGMFSLYGKTWLLTQRESIYGDGQLNLQWDPISKVDGYVGMFIGIPNNKGDVLLAQGKINFEFQNASNYSIKSEQLGGSVLQAIKAEGNIDVNPESLNLAGKLYYNTNKSVSIGVVGVKAAVNVSASAGLNYMYKTYTLKAFAKFKGDWDVDLTTPMGDADIISGNIDLDAELNVSPAMIEVKASADISYDVWIYKDSIKLDLGYTAALQ